MVYLRALAKLIHWLRTVANFLHMRISTNTPNISRPLGEPTLQEIIGLLALFEKFKDPLRFRNSPLGPTQFFEDEIFGCLRDRQLIWGDHSSAIKMAAEWEVVSKLKQTIHQYSKNQQWPKPWVNESKELWIKLAVAECTEYFRFCLAERKITLDNEEMVSKNLGTLFPMYSVGQCYFFIFIAAKDLSDAIQKGYAGRKSESQIMLDACFKCEDYYHKKKKKVSNFRRHAKLPPSVFHQVLHTQIYSHGEEGFNAPPYSLANVCNENLNGNDICTSI